MLLCEAVAHTFLCYRLALTPPHHTTPRPLPPPPPTPGFPCLSVSYLKVIVVCFVALVSTLVFILFFWDIFKLSCQVSLFLVKQMYFLISLFSGPLTFTCSALNCLDGCTLPAVAAAHYPLSALWTDVRCTCYGYSFKSTFPWTLMSLKGFKGQKAFACFYSLGK